MSNLMGIDKIVDSMGYLVMTEDGAVISSGGDLGNAEAMADKFRQLAWTASKINVSSDKGEPFKRLSVIMDNFMYVLTVAHQKIYVCKRPFDPKGPAVA